MSFFDILGVASTGMSAQRIRLSSISANLANTHTTRTDSGGPYQRQDVVFKQIMDGELKGGVKVTEVIKDEKPPILKYEPGHPDADEAGYVAYPNINPIEEMVNMLETTKSYEANTTVLSTAKQLAMKALELGKA
ncbi:MAG: flagellar basal body rod protein FlgC [Denitrovibrio sp.]|nr:MAG: flagellar basal body rod protein FlgC [Denitrovibrio sp.]